MPNSQNSMVLSALISTLILLSAIAFAQPVELRKTNIVDPYNPLRKGEVNVMNAVRSRTDWYQNDTNPDSFYAGIVNIYDDRGRPVVWNIYKSDGKHIYLDSLWYFDANDSSVSTLYSMETGDTSVSINSVKTIRDPSGRIVRKLSYGNSLLYDESTYDYSESPNMMLYTSVFRYYSKDSVIKKMHTYFFNWNNYLLKDIDMMNKDKYVSFKYSGDSVIISYYSSGKLDSSECAHYDEHNNTTLSIRRDRLKSITEQIEYVYNKDNLPLKETHTRGGKIIYERTFTYNERGLLWKAVTSNGEKYIFTYEYYK